MNKNEEKYLNLLREVLASGSSHSDRTGTGTRRLFGTSTTYHLKDGFPLLTTRKMSLRIAAEELIWMLSGSTDNKKLVEKNVHIWTANSSAAESAKFGRKEHDLAYAYGHQFRNFNATKREIPLEEDFWSQKNLRWVNKAVNDDGADQVRELVNTIINNPNSRRMLVSGWHAQEAGLVNPPPCHTIHQVMVDNDEINLALFSRSSDLFLGTSTNIIFYCLLIEVLAMVTNKKAGKFVHLMGDYHIYNDHMDQVREQLTRTPFEAPTIKISERLRGKGFEGLLDFKWEDVEVIGYQSHPAIKAKMSV